MRNYLPTMIDLVLKGEINPGRVLDLTLPLAEVAEGYRAMDERRAIKTLDIIGASDRLYKKPGYDM